MGSGRPLRPPSLMRSVCLGSGWCYLFCRCFLFEAPVLTARLSESLRLKQSAALPSRPLTQGRDACLRALYLVGQRQPLLPNRSPPSGEPLGQGCWTG